MDMVKAYGNLIKKNIDKPETALKLINFGLIIAYYWLSNRHDKRMPKSFKYLNKICVKYIHEPLKRPNNSAWVNLFAPAEILHAMGIYPLFVEAFASFLCGFECEDEFIDRAEQAGIAETLCSYHKAFLGAGITGLLPRPKFAVTTSMICDANINTFRHLTDMYDIPCYVIDIPNHYSSDAEQYVTEQLMEMVCMIEEITGRRLNESRLKDVLITENQTRVFMKRYLDSLETKYFPSTLTMEMFMLFTSHVFMGRQETYRFYQMLCQEIESYPTRRVKKIFWVHLLPYYQATLQRYFNLSDKYQVLGCDLNFDYLDAIDYNNPYRALARKMIQNQYNGGYERRIDGIAKIIKKLKPDGVINFCHWGCKQSSGGVMLLRDAVKDMGIPFLSLDGDGIDKRNGHDGQIKTRLEAFLEILDR
ncbi:MAG: 2-hydroxyacyl-CoA dehydratase subunit D [Mahellales bacterium]|jgi:benzoyl-CoA reductase/2-hydroxyglutaryl-CoA dehydratase subunit BcrC/BadD/HgdB